MPGGQKFTKKRFGAKKIYKGVLRQEKKMAHQEVRKAKKMIHKNKKWSVAAEGMGWKGGYDSKRGGWLHYGSPMQTPAQAALIPASSAHLWKTRYDRKQSGRNLTVSGIQRLGAIQSAGSATNSAFVVNGSPTDAISLSPDTIGGQMATDARNYGYFKFRKVRILAVMNASSTDTLSLGLTYSPDPGIRAYQTVTYESIQSSDNFVSCARKAPTPLALTVRELSNNGQKRYHCEQNTTTAADIQQSTQGIIFGFFSANDASGTQYGDLLIEFELELYDRLPDYGFTVSFPKTEQMMQFAVSRMANVMLGLKCPCEAKVPECQLCAMCVALGGLEEQTRVAISLLKCTKVYDAVFSLLMTNLYDLGMRGGVNALRECCRKAGLGVDPPALAPPVRLIDAASNMYDVKTGKAVTVTGGGIASVLTSAAGVALSTPTIGSGASLAIAPTVNTTLWGRVYTNGIPASTGAGASAGGIPWASVGGTGTAGDEFAQHASDPAGAVMTAAAAVDDYMSVPPPTPVGKTIVRLEKKSAK